MPTARPVIAALLLLTSCSSDAADEPPGAGATELVSESGALAVTLHASPGGVPVRGNNAIDLEIVRVAADEPESGLSLSMVPFMPAMGHGSAVAPECSEREVGHYRCDDVVLAMPGLWELRTTLGGAESDAVVFRFDVK